MNRRQALQAIAPAGLAAMATRPALSADPEFQAFAALLDFLEYADEVLDKHGPRCTCEFCENHRVMGYHVEIYLASVDCPVSEAMKRALAENRRRRSLPELPVVPMPSAEERQRRAKEDSLAALDVARAALLKVARFATPSQEKDAKNARDYIGEDPIIARRLHDAIVLLENGYI